MEAALIGPSGRRVLEPAVLTIGSSPDNQVVIDDPKVSAHQAEIRPDDQSYSITDVGSTHGTYVNGERLDWNTPHRLTPGSTITIGDTTFTYEVTDSPQAEPAVRAGAINGVPASGPGAEAQGGPAPTSPAGEGAPSHSAYGLIVPQGLQPSSPPGSSPLYGVPQPFMPPYQQQGYPSSYPQQPFMQPVYPGTMPGYAGPLPGYAPPAEARPKSRRAVWIAVGVIVILGLLAGGAFVLFTRSTPEKTLDAYCSAIQGQDFVTAYNQLSSSVQNAETESQFANVFQALGRVTSCTHGSANVNGASATANLTFVSSDGGTTSRLVSLVQENGSTWKINMLPFSPAITLETFCHALKSGDYQTAYDQFSSDIKRQVSEGQFETVQRQNDDKVGGISQCTVSNVNESGASASGTVSLVFGNGQSGSANFTLVNENGGWKISNIR